MHERNAKEPKGIALDCSVIASGDQPRSVGACVAVKFAERAGRPCRNGAGGEVGGHTLAPRGPAGDKPDERARRTQRGMGRGQHPCSHWTRCARHEPKVTLPDIAWKLICESIAWRSRNLVFPKGGSFLRLLCRSQPSAALPLGGRARRTSRALHHLVVNVFT